MKSPLRKTLKDVYYIEIPLDLIRIKGWKEGEIIEVLSGASVQARGKDIILRKGD